MIRTICPNCNQKRQQYRPVNCRLTWRLIWCQKDKTAPRHWWWKTRTALYPPTGLAKNRSKSSAQHARNAGFFCLLAFSLPGWLSQIVHFLHFMHSRTLRGKSPLSTSTPPLMKSSAVVCPRTAKSNTGRCAWSFRAILFNDGSILGGGTCRVSTYGLWCRTLGKFTLASQQRVKDDKTGRQGEVGRTAASSQLAFSCGGTTCYPCRYMLLKPSKFSLRLQHSAGSTWE